MKKYGLILCAMLVTISMQAQDIITLTSGRTIRGEVIRVTPAIVVCAVDNNRNKLVTINNIYIATVTYADGSQSIYNPTDSLMSGNGRKTPGNGYKHGYVHGWYFGLTASGGAGTATNINDPNYTAGSNYYGGFNLMATRTIGQHFGIQFGLGADRYAYTVKYTNNSLYSGSSDVFVQRYGTIPIRAIYLSNSRRRVGIYATAGLDFSLLAGATDDFGDLMASYYNNILVSYYGSCGVILRNNDAHCIWMLGPYIKSSMNNIYSGESLRYEGSPFVAAGNVGTFTTIGVTLSFMVNFENLTQEQDDD